LPELFFEAPETAADPYWVLRIIHYPTLPSNAPGLSCGEHCDYGLLTLGVMTQARRRSLSHL